MSSMPSVTDPPCQTCRSLAGEIVLTNAPRLELDAHWRVEHGAPVARAGWLVLVLRRHARALHELTPAEAAAFGRWLPALIAALHRATGSELEYVLQFAEKPGFHHVHVHLVARMPDWPAELTGPAVLSGLGDGVAHPISAEAATAVIEAVGADLGIAPLSWG